MPETIPLGRGSLGLKHRLPDPKTAVFFDGELRIEGKNHTVFVSVLQRNRTNRMCIHTYLERDFIPSNWLTGLWKFGKFRICRWASRLETQGRDAAGVQRQSVCWQNCLLVGGGQVWFW